jgi:hypothetical protein
MKPTAFALPGVAFLVFAGSLAAQVNATISSQGTRPITETTGYTPKTAVLARVDVCNDGDSDANVATSRVAASLITAEQFSLYDSDVVDAVLAALQQKDAFTRAQKALAAGTNAATLITAMFKTLSPATIAILQAAPAIAAAILPAVGDPRDLALLSRKIQQDNTVFVLGKKGAGNDCHTGLVVAMSGAIKIDRVQVQ